MNEQVHLRLREIFSRPGRSNDFRTLRSRLTLLATELDTGRAVAFGTPGWDHVPPGRRIPCGESAMWGDYHLRELALMIRRMARSEPYYTFFAI